jgi:hypothetical protein
VNRTETCDGGETGGDWRARRYTSVTVSDIASSPPLREWLIRQQDCMLHPHAGERYVWHLGGMKLSSPPPLRVMRFVDGNGVLRPALSASGACPSFR